MATFTIVESRIVIAAPQTTTAAAASTGRPRSRIPPHILAGSRHPRTARKSSPSRGSARSHRLGSLHHWYLTAWSAW